MADKQEEYKGYLIRAKQIGVYYGTCVYSPSQRLIYETPAEFHYQESAIDNGLSWLKRVWLKAD